MKFTIKKDEFFKGLSIVSKAINNTAEPVVLRNIKLDLNENGLFLIGSNYNVTIKTFIPFKDGENGIIRNYKEGSILLNGKHLFDTVSRLKSDEISIDIVDSIALITSDTGKSKKELNFIPSEEYPDLDLELTGIELHLSKKDFIAMVSQTAFAASVKDARPTLVAINLEASDGVLTATATDSARLARKQINIPEDIQLNINIPARTMVEISHLVEDSDEVNCYFTDKRALFTFGRTIVSTSLISGDYPNTKTIIPRITNYSLEINSDELINAIESTRIMSIDRENVVDLNMSSDAVEFSAKSSQAGSALEQIETFRYEGSPLKIAFNCEHVLSAVKALNCPDVLFEFIGEMKLFVIKNPSDDSVIQICTPIRTN